MNIHVVKVGDTIGSIAEQYGVTVQRIVLDNVLVIQEPLVPGQTLVILYPEKTYTVQEGDTLQGIAEANDISVTQLYRNNSFLSEREYIYPGETLVISYNNTKGKVTIGGFAYPHLNKKTLVKSLPFLTYLSIFNYTITGNGELITYYDDTELIQISKDYGVAPLLLLTTLSVKGEPNIQIVYDILTNDELQDRYIEIVFDMVKAKGYYGINLVFQYLNTSNQNLYISLFQKVIIAANSLEIPLYVTINPNKTFVGNELVYEDVDYSIFNQGASNVTFINFQWGYNFGPPVPIASINDLHSLIDYTVNYIIPEKTGVGIPIMGYDWELPYIVGFSSAYSLKLDSVITLAREVGAVIEFDEISETPYFTYIELNSGIQHLVWFIDARTIDSLMNLVSEYGLQGTGVWNIMNYYPQMWLVINSQYEIERIL